MSSADILAWDPKMVLIARCLLICQESEDKSCVTLVMSQLCVRSNLLMLSYAFLVITAMFVDAPAG